MQKPRIWSQYLLLVPIFASFIWFDQTHPQYNAQSAFYGALAEIAIGAGLIGWSAFRIFRSHVVRPHFALAMIGVGLIVTELGIYPRVNQAVFWLGFTISFTGLVAHTHYRNRSGILRTWA